MSLGPGPWRCLGVWSGPVLPTSLGPWCCVQCLLQSVQGSRAEGVVSVTTCTPQVLSFWDTLVGRN